MMDQSQLGSIFYSNKGPSDMARRTIYLVIKDRDVNSFCIEGPMTDDTAWVHAVLNAQKANREVTCEDIEPQNLDEVRRDYSRQMEEVSSGQIVSIHFSN